MISIKIWEAPLPWQAKISLPVAVRLSKTRVLKLPNITTRVTYEIYAARFPDVVVVLILRVR